VGSLQRFEHNRNIVYCTRGQRIIDPTSIATETYQAYVNALYANPHQHPDARNINNIEAKQSLGDHPYLIQHQIRLCHDPSHIWGGKTDLMRRKIGEYAVKAIRDYGYDWIMIEVDDRSADAICDADQAIVTTTNGIDWSKTNARNEPQIKPLTLVDITAQLIAFQAQKAGIDPEKVREDTRELKGIRWDMSAE
jgi:hypothetical protein